ncbi:histidinol-phosphate aminotransferase family protein [Dethiosulfovibrio sp. F2B]|uniref:pyridoxal phosphate-dependent aminotransferase n=1 Tax=Dethiosulfovibrio faecalis TaxID=2720018 RepID=UPI001F2C4C3E|nr:histidinol-phosphate aminotransferase family protein [Dethiosulfovibrio faecalis]
MIPRPVSDFDGLGPVVHGGMDREKLDSMGLDVDDILDFSVSINPLSPHEDVLKASRSAELDIYPDRSAWKLRERLSDLHGVDSSRVLVTNGASQAIWLVSMAYLRSGRKTSVVVPAYGEYIQAASALGASVSRWDFGDFMTGDSSGFSRSLHDRIRTEPPEVLWICSPNNPTGYALSRSQIESILDICKVGPTMVVLDEAYRNFMETPPDLEDLLDTGRLLILRSMTKDYGLPGVRLGYALGSSDSISAMEKVQPDWSVGAQAQAVGVALLENREHYERQWELLRIEKKRLSDGLKRIGVTVISGEGNFLLCRHRRWSELKTYLWSKRIQLRDCASFGLENYFRIGIKTVDMDDLLLKEISSFLLGEETFG